MQWQLYLIRNAPGQLYTGISTDPGRRLRQHESGKGSRSLRGKGPLALVFSEAVGDRSRASRLEALVKKLPRSAKEALVRGELRLRDLLEEPAPAPRSAASGGATAL